MMSGEENAVILLSPPLPDSLRIVITSRESFLSLFPTVAYSSTARVEKSFPYSCLHEIPSAFQCVQERTRCSQFTFLTKFLFLKGLFFPWLFFGVVGVCWVFFFPPLAFSPCQSTGDWEELIKSTNDCLVLVKPKYSSFLVLCLLPGLLSTLDFFLIIQRPVWFLYQPWNKMLQYPLLEMLLNF